MYTVEVSYKLHGIPFTARVQTPAFSEVDACAVVRLCAQKMFQGLSDIKTEIVK